MLHQISRQPPPPPRPRRTVLVAEVVAHFYPRLVELHNYSSANSLSQKMYNWNTLNSKARTCHTLVVFFQLNFSSASAYLQLDFSLAPAWLQHL